MHAGRAAGKEDEEKGKEQRDGAYQNCPDTSREGRMATAAVLIDMVPYYDKEREVGGHDDQRDDEGHGGNESCEEGAAHSRTERDEEGDEGEAGDDGVQNHDASEHLCGIRGGSVEGGVVDRRHNRSRVIANVSGGAVVMIGASAKKSLISHLYAPLRQDIHTQHAECSNQRYRMSRQIGGHQSRW